MKAYTRIAAFLILTVPAVGQGFMTPQGLTQAGAGGPITGTIPHGITYPSPPPVNNGLNNSSAITPSMPTSANKSPAMKRVPVIVPPITRVKAGKNGRRPAKEVAPYDLKDGGTPSIMIEERPGR